MRAESPATSVTVKSSQIYGTSAFAYIVAIVRHPCYCRKPPARVIAVLDTAIFYHNRLSGQAR